MRLLRRMVRFVFRSVFLTIVTLVAAPVVAGTTILAVLVFLPLPATIPVPKAIVAVQPTVIYDRYGNPIATLKEYDQNVPVAESDIPTDLKQAVISDEDRNFYRHGGVDVRGTVRALIADLRNQGPLQGGSTITQQYVKLAYTGGQRNVARKVREAILASQLNRQAGKDEILYRYLTIIYFGDGNYGVGAAAENYFHVPVSRLTVSEAATLAGLVPAPSARAPRENLTGAEQARELVLGRMFQQGYLTEAEYGQAMAQRLFLATTPPPAGVTVVYPATSLSTPYPDFVDYVTRWLLAHYPPSEVYGGGLRIQTTLDPTIQDSAYAAVRSTLNGTSEPLEMALASVEPQTGFVEAIVGGRQFGSGPYADVNLALGGCDPAPAASATIAVPATCWQGGTIGGGGGGRQPGSAWKPFVLATAFAQGISPSKVYPAPGAYDIPDCKPTITNTCKIHNDEPASIGTATLTEATAESINTVYAQLINDVGCPATAATAKALGIDSAYYSQPPFYYCSSYALGEVDVSPLDMASAYGVFDDHGQKAAPTPILEIINGSGRVLVDNIGVPPSTTSVLPANVADNVTSVLQGVLTHGTGTAAALGRPAAGKTGTTSNYTNAWFVGYTPSLSTAVWMGRADSQSVTIGSVKRVQPVYGGTWPAVTWKAFMLQALQGVPATGFTQPAPITPPAARVLTTTTVTTRPTLAPAAPSPVIGTGSGGPYVYGPPPFSAPDPPAVTTTVPAPALMTTTTVPATTTDPAGTPTATTG